MSVEEIEIVDLIHDGRGVGRLAPLGSSDRGKTCFIAGALPGESVLWRKTNSKRSFDEGFCTEVLRASVARVEPKCEYYAGCGGCELQHLDVSAQLQWKERQLKKTVTKVGLDAGAWLPALGADVWHYRRRTRLAVDYPRRGTPQLGFRKRGSRQVVAIEHCDVLDDRLNNLLPLLREFVSQLKNKGLEQIELSAADEQLAICLNVKKSVDIEQLAPLLDGQANLQLWQKLPRQSAEQLVVGEPLQTQLTEQASMIFTPGQFVQVNGEMNRAMLQQAINLARPQKTDRILDLFCGGGNFSLAFAPLVESVFGVEGSVTLVQQARANAQLNGYENTEFKAVDLNKSEQFGRLGKESFDLVILDPPREGAAELMPWLSKLVAPKILYISCHPATMVRDMQTLANVYKIESMGVMDMFPHTAHLEAMALLVYK